MFMIKPNVSLKKHSDNCESEQENKMLEFISIKPVVLTNKFDCNHFQFLLACNVDPSVYVFTAFTLPSFSVLVWSLVV